MGMRQAINEKCRDCIYDPQVKGTWRAQVEACTMTECSLHPFRPRCGASKAYAKVRNDADFVHSGEELPAVQVH
jgi:hypothetical protein